MASTADLAKALMVAEWRNDHFALYEAVRKAPMPAVGHAIWNATRERLFTSSDTASPLIGAGRVAGVLSSKVEAWARERVPLVSPYDSAWRFEDLKVSPRATGETFEYETGTDGLVRFLLVGEVKVPKGVGKLGIWKQQGYGGGIWIPIKDGLAGKDGGTYGGGRYLIDTIKGAELGPHDGTMRMTLDFNFAYNPSCAYDSTWACPLAPTQNWTGAEIPVGEMYSPVGDPE